MWKLKFSAVSTYGMQPPLLDGLERVAGSGECADQKLPGQNAGEWPDIFVEESCLGATESLHNLSYTLSMIK